MTDHCAKLSYHPDYLLYDFGPHHPLRPERITAGLELMETTGLWDRHQDGLDAAPADARELALVHDPHYVRLVESASIDWVPRAELARFGLTSSDNPPFPDMHYAASKIAGGAVAAARAIMEGHIDHAFHPAGGWHHALRARASGFCVYNDAALAAAVMVRDYGARVLYIDVDCHHGDGVQWIFYDRPDVLTISFHESGRYLFPGTGDVGEIGEGAGRGFAVNVPMAPFTQDDSWVDALHRILPPLAARFSPDVVLSAHGADTHLWDPITHLALTTRSFVEQTQLIHQLAHQYADGRWLAFGSGGYDWRRVVPRSWSIVWAEMSGRDLPSKLPSTWRAQWSGDDEPIPEAMLDAGDLTASIPRGEETRRLNEDTVRAAMRIAGLPAAPETFSAAIE